MDSDFLPFNFLVLAAKAMAVLHANGKDNLIYHAARCFGEQRQGSTGPRMPLDRMPFGLVAHNLKFFASDNVSNLQAPDDYKSWCQSMYTLFGNKWASMHLGPMWSYEVSENISATANTGRKNRFTITLPATKLIAKICENLLMECFRFATAKFASTLRNRMQHTQSRLQFCNRFASDVNLLWIY